MLRRAVCSWKASRFGPSRSRAAIFCHADPTPSPQDPNTRIASSAQRVRCFYAVIRATPLWGLSRLTSSFLKIFAVVLTTPTWPIIGGGVLSAPAKDDVAAVRRDPEWGDRMQRFTGLYKCTRVLRAPLPPPPRLRTPPPLRAALGRLPPPPGAAAGHPVIPRSAEGGAANQSHGATAASTLPPLPPLAGMHTGSCALTQSSFILKSPQEVLSCFVEVVPTFYVPMHAIGAILSEDIREEFQGRGKLLSFFRRFPFFFDICTDAVSSRMDVRLRSDVSHPRRGVADEKFAMTDIGETTQYVAKPDFLVSLEPIDSGSSSGSVSVNPPMAPPAVRVNLEERVPVLDRLRALVPEKDFMAMEELEEVLPEDVLFHPYFDCQGGLAAIASKFPEHFQVVKGQIRIRPAELSPLALDSLSLDSSPLPEVAQIVYREVCQETIPRWVSLTPLYERLTVAQRRQIKKQFKSFAGFLRSHGKSVSISQDMLQVAKWIPPQRTSLPSHGGHTSSGNSQQHLSNPLNAAAPTSAKTTCSAEPSTTTETSKQNKKCAGTTTSTSSDASSHVSGAAEAKDKDFSAAEDNTAVPGTHTQPVATASPSSSAFSGVSDTQRERIRSDAMLRSYTRMQLLNAMFDRFPPDAVLTPREVYGLLPDDLHPSSLPKRFVQWLVSFPNYFILEENGTPVAGLGAQGEEGARPPRVQHLDDDVPCVRRSSSRPPLDLARLLYLQFPADLSVCGFETLLAKMRPAQQHVLRSIGPQQLTRLLPAWLKLLTPQEAAVARTSATSSPNSKTSEGAEGREGPSASLPPLETSLWYVERRQTLEALESAIRSESSKIEKRGDGGEATPQHSKEKSSTGTSSSAAKTGSSENPEDWIKDFTSIQTLLREEVERKSKHHSFHSHRPPSQHSTSTPEEKDMKESPQRHSSSSAPHHRNKTNAAPQKQRNDANTTTPSRSAKAQSDSEGSAEKREIRKPKWSGGFSMPDQRMTRDSTPHGNGSQQRLHGGSASPPPHDKTKSRPSSSSHEREPRATTGQGFGRHSSEKPPTRWQQQQPAQQPPSNPPPSQR